MKTEDNATKRSIGRNFLMIGTPIMLVLLIVVAITCGGSSGGGGGSDDCSSAVAVNTLDGSTGVVTNSSFCYTFDGQVDPTTVTVSSFFIVLTPTPPSVSADLDKAAVDPTTCNSDNALSASLSVDAHTGSHTYALLNPANTMTASTGYTICLTSDIQVDGAPFAGLMAGFTTADNHEAQTQRLRITNSCSYAIWIQQQNMPAGTPDVVKIEPGNSNDYEIPDAGIQSTRFLPKKGCDATGNDCEIGQSLPPCPTTQRGCSPAINSKLEATWGCLLSDQSQCAVDAGGNPLVNTFYNSSAVDGWTFPFKIDIVDGTIADACVNIDCSLLDYNRCPTDEDLSQGGTYPQYANSDLRMFNADGKQVGCFSPCKKFNNVTTWGGYGLTTDSADEDKLYCCPTPPISSEECRAGPIVNTTYVTVVHDMCPGGGYAYAYDDNASNHNCPAATKFELTFGPNCP